MSSTVIGTYPARPRQALCAYLSNTRSESVKVNPTGQVQSLFSLLASRGVCQLVPTRWQQARQLLMDLIELA